MIFKRRSKGLYSVNAGYMRDIQGFDRGMPLNLRPIGYWTRRVDVGFRAYIGLLKGWTRKQKLI